MINKFKENKTTLIIALAVVILILAGYAVFQNYSQTLREGQIADYIHRAQAAEEDAQYQEAFNLYAQALDLDFENQTALTGMGDVAFNVGDYETAVSYYQQTGQDNRAESHYFLALKAAGEQDLSAAIKELTVAQQQVNAQSALAPSKVDSLKQQFQEVIKKENEVLRQAQLGRILIQEKTPNLAINVLKPLTKKEPDYRDAHYLLGAAYFQANQNENARKSLNTALEIDKNYEPAKELLLEVQN